MFKSSIDSDDYNGNILAFGCALSFSIFILIIRNFRNIDLMPSSLIGGIFIVIVSFIFKAVSYTHLTLPTILLV